MLGNLAVYTVELGDVALRLRELCGGDAMAVDGADTRAAVDLIDRLIVRPGGCAPPVGAHHAGQLTAPERDRVLAEIHRRTFGSRIAGSPRCTECEATFDSDFDLDALVADIWPGRPARQVLLGGARRFRVPAGDDELAVAALDRGAALWELTRRCALDPLESADLDRVARAFAAALDVEAPVLDLELAAVCPECGATNQIAFRMQAYLARMLAAERTRLAGDLDALGRAYGWAPSEILALPRATRLQLVRFAEANPARNPARRWA